MYSDRRGNVQIKLPRTKPSRQKTPDKTHRAKPPRTFEREFVQGAFVRVLCTRPTENRGGPEMCNLLLGVLGCVTKCDRGDGVSKLAKNSVTYFMDGPLYV